jgi:hypothetical protein
MRERALRSVLLIKAIEEADREGALIPPADRAAASREARRGGAAGAGAPAPAGGGPLTREAQRLLADRAEILRRRVTARFPFVETVLALAGVPAWAGGLLAALGLLGGVSLSALDGARRINVLAFPLIGLSLWNLLVYVGLALRRARAIAGAPRRPLLPGLLAGGALRRVTRLVSRSAAYNAPLASALGRFASEWYEAARPLLVARASRALHLCAAAVALGLIAGLYVRGVVLDYRAGWESTFLDAHQVWRIVSVAYAPASRVTGVAIPDEARIAAMRWEGAQGGEGAAPWIHLLAATAGLVVVLPRLALALASTAAVWRHSLSAPGPPALAPYFRAAFRDVEGVVGRGIIAVVPYAYEPVPVATARLGRLLPAALGETLAVDVRAPVRYGEEEVFLETLAERGGAVADAIALLFTLAATPEEENHGSVMAGVRDWIAHSRPHVQLVVLVDERPYAERMPAEAGLADRLAERRRTWQAFAGARGLRACFVDLGEGADAEAGDVERVRGALWQGAPA